LFVFYFLRINGGSLVVGFSDSVGMTFKGGTFDLFTKGSGDYGALELELRSRKVFLSKVGEIILSEFYYNV
jgi:hypothetical protein